MVEKEERPMIAPTPHARLKLARERVFDSASKAAEAMKIPKGTYLGLENGSRAITAERARQVATRFRVTPEWILYGRGTVLPQSVNKMSQSISIVYASDVSAFRTLSCGKYLEIESTRQFAMPVNCAAGGKKEKRLIGVETEDDAMARDKSPSYCAGVIIIFDPDQAPKPGNLVWASIANRDEPVIREYTRAMSSTGGPPAVILKAYNPSYESIPFDEAAGDKIGGVFDPHAARLAVYMQAG